MSFNGLVAEFPIGRDGLSGSSNPSQVGPGHLIVADSVIYEGGVLRKEGGATKYNSSAISGTPSVYGGYDWWPTSSTQRQILLTSGGKILSDSGGVTFPTELRTGLGTSQADKVPMFVEAGKEASAQNRKLFIYSGEDQVQVLSGDGVYNHASYSQTYSNAAWTKSNVDLTTGQSGPLGALTATEFKENTTSSTFFGADGPTISTMGSTFDVTVNAYLKAGTGRTWARVQFRDRANVANYVDFQLSGGGTVGTAGGSTSTRNITTAGLASGWYHASFVVSTGVGATTPYISVFICSADNTPVYTGVVGNGIFVGGMWVQTGSARQDYTVTPGAAGADVGPIYGYPADWASTYPTCGVIHNGRHWGGGNSNDAHRLYYTTASNHQDFNGSGSGSISVYPGVGQKIVSVVSFKGLLIVAKYPRGIYAIDTSDLSNPITKVISNVVGAVGPGALLPIDDDVLILDPQGHFHLLSATQEFGDARASTISQRDGIDVFAKDTFNLAKLSRARSVYYPARREAQFAVPSLNATTNDMRVVVDFSRQDQPRFRTSTLVTSEALWLKMDSLLVPRPTAGDNAGFVWLLDQTTRSKDGAGFAATFQSGHYDFSFVDPGLASKVKYGRFLELSLESVGSGNLTIEALWDDLLVQTITFNSGTLGSSLGTGALDTMTLGAVSVRNRKKRLVGGGRRLSLRGYNSGAAEDFAISRFLVHFQAGDERKGDT